MFERLKRLRENVLVERRPIADADWAALVEELRILDHLDDAERTALRRLATIFARRTTFVGTHGLEVSEYMKAAVAVQACLPILHLGLDYYRELRTVVLYPGAFVADREFEDEIGVVHEGVEELDGESMEGGPMALSWDEVDPAREDASTNVVVHECAHKLDELTGAPNGLPPLHRGMSVETWAAAFTHAYAHFGAAVEALEAAGSDAPLVVDDYAATDPAEFFAVMSEAFFASPADVAREYPEVYAQLALFYRQHPAGSTRLGPGARTASPQAGRAPGPSSTRPDRQS
jgi:hypothetical protein